MMDGVKKELAKKGEVYIRVKVRPGASRTCFVDIMDDDTIKINIAAKPEKNLANIELMNFLSRSFTVDKDNIKILSGKTERTKLIKLTK